MSTTDYMNTAMSKANGEWWQIFACAVLILAVICVISYCQFGKAIWIADVKKNTKKKHTLKIVRHVVAGVFVAGTIAFLIFAKLHKTPVNIVREFEGYNINCIGRTAEEKAGYTETVDSIALDLVLKKNIFKEDELAGVAVVEGVTYEADLQSSSDKRGDYYMSFAKPRTGVMDSFMLTDLQLNILKDFNRCVFQVDDIGGDGFIAPASVENAEDVLKEFNKKNID